MATTDLHFVCGALQPTKRGMRFLGGAVDDGIQVDAAAVAIVAGNHDIGTFSAWIMVPDDTGTYSFMGFGDANAVEYVHFTVEAGTINVMMVKATPVTQLDVNTASGTIKPHTWHHIAIVQDGVAMKIYIDGEDMALSWTTATDKAQWFDDLNNIDGAHIGCADSVAGGAALTNEFKGYISDVRIWSSTIATDTAKTCALSQAQVQAVMSGDTSIVTTYLHNHWSLNQVVTDAGTGADDGTIVGDLIYSDGNEFSSRLTFLETVPLTADNITIMCDGGVGYAYCVLAA